MKEMLDRGRMRDIVFGPLPDDPKDTEEEIASYYKKAFNRGTAAVPNTSNMKKLTELLIKHGGKIISSNDCSVLEIAEARADNRMWVDENGFGFIFMPKDYAAYRHAVYGTCFETN
jgi:hypothetical protein